MDPEKQVIVVKPVSRRRWRGLAFSCLALLLILRLAAYSSPAPQSAIGSTPATAVHHDDDCLDEVEGYICSPETSRYWAQYSPYYKVPSEIPAEVPEGCHVTFAQVLSRHAARDPKLKQIANYTQLIDNIKSNGHPEGRYAFLQNYTLNLGADQISGLGIRQSQQSGRRALQRYSHLGSPFVRATDATYTVDTAREFLNGFGRSHDDVLVIPMETNNTLRHSQCANLESGLMGYVREAPRIVWGNIFLPPIAMRLAEDLGVNFTMKDTHTFMSMCPMTTVNDPKGRPTPFCDLFTHEEWQQYNHFESLEKYYGWGPGNPLGPTQGVGWVNELIARMLQKPVNILGSINSTLDTDPATFPLDRKLYADFSHDDDMTSAFFLLGMFSRTPDLSITRLDSPVDYLDDWTISRTVGFSNRAYFEKMRCAGHDEELVRVLVNERVVPLLKCDPDFYGRCTLSNFIDSLSFARMGGNWPMCYEETIS